MAAFATTDDVASRWRTLTTAEEDVAETLLDDASAMLREAVTGIDALITAGDIDRATALRVVAFAVIRAMRNPGGVESRTHSIDDYTTTERYAADARGQLYLSSEDFAAVTPAGSSEAFTITPFGYAHNAYVAAWEATL